MTQWSLEPVFGWLAVVPLALVMLASLWFTLTAEGVGWLGRGWLLLLRLVAILLLLLGWLRPGLVSTIQRDSDAAVAVLIDASQSMTMPSGYGEKTRWAVAQEAWEAIERESGRNFGKTHFVPYYFDFNLRGLPTGPPAGQAAQKASSMAAIWKAGPNGKVTDLGTALAELQRAQVDPPLRATFMITDGMQTVIPAVTDATLVARQLEQLDQPIIVVGLGPRSEKSQLRDLAIDGVPEHVTAFEKNKVMVPAVVHARGLQNLPIKVDMKLKAAGKPDIVLKPVEVLASGADQTMPMNFDIEAPASGEYLLELKATTTANELVTSNNITFAFMTVRAGGSRILYLEGQPRHEQTFLRRSLSSLDFQVEYYWIPESERPRWPIDLSRRLNLSSYDAFILGDVDARALFSKSNPRTAATLNAIRQRVEGGAGLLILGGFHSYDAGGYADSPLASIFPVQLKAGRAQEFGEADIDPAFHLNGPQKFVPTRPHPITTFTSEPENARIWNSLAPLRGANRLGKPKLAPGITEVAANSAGADGDPLLVAGEFGRGRVLAFAGDSTFQWCLQGQQLRHKQFWRQAMLWLLSRDTMQDGFRLTLDRRRLRRGDEETVGIEWVAGTDNKPMPAKIDLELYREGRVLSNLDSQAAGENRRQVKLKDLNEPGLYRLALKAVDGEGKSYSSDIAFVVRDESRELSSPAADWQMMQNIASATDRAGGRLITPDEIGEAMQWLRDRQSQARVTTLEKRRLGDGVWDSWIYFVLFCSVMTLEWATRKKWQLP